MAVPPPVSVLIARDPGGYLAGLYDFRAGSLDRWVSWFARVVERAADRSLDWSDDVDEVLAGWRHQVEDLRADATARRVVELLAAHPVVDVATVSAALGVSDVAARSALVQLEERSVLRAWHRSDGAPGRPRRWWAAPALLQLVGGWAG